MQEVEHRFYTSKINKISDSFCSIHTVVMAVVTVLAQHNRLLELLLGTPTLHYTHPQAMYAIMNNDSNVKHSTFLCNEY